LIEEFILAVALTYLFRLPSSWIEIEGLLTGISDVPLANMKVQKMHEDNSTECRNTFDSETKTYGINPIGLAFTQMVYRR